MAKTASHSLMKDFLEQFDVAVGGISVSTDRQKTEYSTTAYMVNGKAPIPKCENVAKFQTVADIDKPNVTAEMRRSRDGWTRGSISPRRLANTTGSPGAGYVEP